MRRFFSFFSFIFFILLVFAVISVLPAFVADAHSAYLFGISLDFDKELKSGVVSAAQSFSSTKKQPIGFDLDKGLIMVHFEPEQRNYVEINPLDYSVHGMRNENLKSNSVKKLTKEQGLGIAKGLFDKLPDSAKTELKYNDDVSEVDSTYFYKWFRHVKGILVADENFMVNVASNGSIIAWRLSNFDYPKESIKTVPAVSMSIARKVAELSFNAPSVRDFEPYLIIYSNEPVWVNRLQGQFYPFYIGVNAMDGSISFSGTLPGEVPKDYRTGDVQAVETDEIKEIYSK